MSGFVRKFNQDPGNAELTSIEGVAIIDREPPGNILGAASGIALLVGEFEDGEYNFPTEISSGVDLQRQFGGFGFTYDGVASQNPCARSRKSDNALLPEYWNGNGFIATANKKFSKLIVCRADTSVGEVQFTRMASVLGAFAPTYDLEHNQTSKFAVNNADGLDSPARITSAAGSYPTAFGAGTLSVKVNGAAAIVITFTSAHTTRELVMAKINNDLGYVAATAHATDATKIVLASSTRGTSSSLEITAVTGLTTSAIGFSVTAVTNGTLNTSTATFTGAVAALASAAGVYPSTFVGGETVKITIDENTPQQIGPITVTFQASDQTQAQCISRINTALGYTAAVSTSATVMTISGRVKGSSGNVKVTAVSAVLVTTATGLSVASASGTGNVANIDQVTFAEVKSVLELAVSGLTIEKSPEGKLRARASTSVWVGAQTATALGFVDGDSDLSTSGLATTIPAGTRVTDGVTTWVTAKTTEVKAGSPGPYTVRIRPANDDGTALGAATGKVTSLVSTISDESYTVNNELPIAAALTESAIDAAYVKALDSTLNANSVARTSNLIWSARSSNAVRSTLRTNAVQAKAEGLSGRVAFIRPPLGTTRSQAMSKTAQPGVGMYRNDSVVYCYPGAAMFVSQIAALGLTGGAGFTADGIVDVGFDSFVVSICSQLPPEENPGQLTNFMTAISSIERGNKDVSDLRVDDYKSFKSAGIAALRIDDGVAIIQSGKTSVDPSVMPNLQNIARRRMAYFVQDSLAPRVKSFNKKLSSKERRALIVGEIEGFMASLLSANNPSNQRIDSYLVDAVSGNTPDGIAAGIFRIIVKVRTLSSLDVIVLDTEVGENVVTIREAA